MPTEAQKRATQKYIKNHYETLATILPKGTKQVIKKEAEKKGVSLNRFVKDALAACTSNGELREQLLKGKENEPRTFA